MTNFDEISRAWESSLIGQTAKRYRIEPLIWAMIASARSNRDLEKYNGCLPGNRRLPLNLIKELKQFRTKFASGDDLANWALNRISSFNCFGYQSSLDYLYLLEVQRFLGPRIETDTPFYEDTPKGYRDIDLELNNYASCGITIGSRHFRAKIYINTSSWTILVGFRIIAKTLTEPEARDLQSLFSQKSVGYVNGQAYLRGDECCIAFVSLQINPPRELSDREILDWLEVNTRSVGIGYAVRPVYQVKNPRSNIISIIQKGVERIFGRAVTVSST